MLVIGVTTLILLFSITIGEVCINQWIHGSSNVEEDDCGVVQAITFDYKLQGVAREEEENGRNYNDNESFYFNFQIWYYYYHIMCVFD